MKSQQDVAQDIERRAQNLKWAGDCAGALRLRLELEQLHRQIGAGVAEQAKNLNYLAHVAVHAGDLAEAERAARRCLELSRRCLELYRSIALDQDEKLATYMMMLSCVLAEKGEFEEAVAYGNGAAAIFEQNHGADDSFVVDRRRDINRMRRQGAGPYLDR